MPFWLLWCLGVVLLATFVTGGLLRERGHRAGVLLMVVAGAGQCLSILVVAAVV